MQIYIRPMAIITLVAALGAAGAPTTLVRSNIPYRQAFSACKEGALGAVVISPTGHVRVSLGTGVQADIDDANPNAQVITLTDSEKSQSATITVNAAANTVTGNGVAPAPSNLARSASRNVACVTPG